MPHGLRSIFSVFIRLQCADTLTTTLRQSRAISRSVALQLGIIIRCLTYRLH